MVNVAVVDCHSVEQSWLLRGRFYK